MKFRPFAPVRVAVLAALVALAALPSVVALGADVSVRIRDAFEPADLTVTPGSTVTWLNESGERRRIRTTSGPVEIDSGNLDPGASFSVVLTVLGTYVYLDDRNPDDPAYRGRIVVVATPSTPPAAPGGSVPGASSPATTPLEASVGMAGRRFGPASVTIASGGTVTWRNDDDDDHTVTSADGAFGSGTLAPGATFGHAFTNPGTYGYLCAIHPDMRGTVVVVAAGAPDPGPSPAPPTVAPTPATVDPTPTAGASGSPDPAAGAAAPGGAGSSEDGGDPGLARGRTNLGLLGVVLTAGLSSGGLVLFLRAIAGAMPRRP